MRVKIEVLYFVKKNTLYFDQSDQKKKDVKKNGGEGGYSFPIS